MVGIETLYEEGKGLVDAYNKQTHERAYSRIDGIDYESWMAKVINYADDMPDGSLKRELEELYRRRNYYLDTMSAEKVLGVLGAILSTEYDVKRGESEMKIFISHSSKDKVFGDILLGLLKGLGLGRNEIIYTSNDLYGIPLGKKIYSYLRDNIDTNVHILFLLSDNYFDSVACLND